MAGAAADFVTAGGLEEKVSEAIAIKESIGVTAAVAVPVPVTPMSAEDPLVDKFLPQDVQGLKDLVRERGFNLEC